VDRDLFVLDAGNGRDRVIDVYDAETGSYRWSLRPPEPDARYVVLTADRLFSASRRGVTIWRRMEAAATATSGTRPDRSSSAR
jgi:hypothetical protein